MGYFKHKNHFPVDGRTVLLTGASQGMGQSVARMLAQKGANVLIVSRTVEKLRVVTAEMSAAAIHPTQRFRFISADLTIPSESVRVISQATEWNNGAPPDIVWCLAGTSHPALFIDTPVEKLKEQMDSNYFSSAYMAHAALSAWLKPSIFGPETLSSGTEPKESRHLIFTSSVVAFFPLVGYNPYSPPKCALRSLSDGLSQEMALYSASGRPPVSLHTIFPATILTAAYEAENVIKPDVTKKLEEEDGGQTADQAAAKSIEGLQRGQELVPTEILGRAMMCSMLGASKRNGWAVIDTVLSWVMVIVMAFVRWDYDSKTRKWGAANGTSGMLKKS